MCHCHANENILTKMTYDDLLYSNLLLRKDEIFLDIFNDAEIAKEYSLFVFSIIAPDDKIEKYKIELYDKNENWMVIFNYIESEESSNEKIIQEQLDKYNNFVLIFEKRNGKIIALSKV